MSPHVCLQIRRRRWCYKLIHVSYHIRSRMLKLIIRIRFSLASSHVSSRLPPNKAPSLMLRINTCELPHTNAYVVNQSYEFVLGHLPKHNPSWIVNCYMPHRFSLLLLYSDCIADTFFPINCRRWLPFFIHNMIQVLPQFWFTAIKSF